MMAMLRSTLHMAFMFVTVIPYTLLILLARLLGAKGDVRYANCPKVAQAQCGCRARHHGHPLRSARPRELARG